MKLVLASSNSGKLAELRTLLADLDIELLAQSEFGVVDADETATTFVENALIKARHACRETGLPALADDSGLVVDALDGAPGLYSARYSGSHGNHPANIAKLLSALDGVPTAARTAHFYAVVVLLRSETDPQPLIAEGTWSGLILEAPRGTGGFGYDPVFLDPEQGLSAAEMDPALKHRLSHRGQALAHLRDRLSEGFR